MANIFGFSTLYTTQPETWIIDGYVQVGSDGYTVSTSPLPKAVAGLTHNATGDYTLLLQDCWYSLLFFGLETELSTGSSPALLLHQVVSSNVGVAGTLNGEQGVRFKLFGVNGSAANLPASGGFRFLFILQRNSAY